ncbi:MAG: permease-like cell division protein FtsX [bacterium]|nr:permease-like cell division protein FtsX [bacterium]
MSLWKEMKFSLARHRLRFFLYFVSLLMVGLIFVMVIYSLHFGIQIRNDVLRQFELEIFLSPTISQADLESIVQKLKQKVPPGTKFRYISQEEALKIFSNEFGDDLVQLLGMNPLPPSVVLTLPSEIANPTYMRNLQQFSNQLSGVDEAVYEGELASIFEVRYKQIQKYFLVAGVIVLFILLSLSFLAIRSTVTDSSDVVRIFSLLGAKSSYFRNPYLLLSTFLGFLSFTFAMGCWWIIHFLSNKIGIGYYLPFPIELFPLPVVGMLLGFFLSFFSTMGFRKIQQYRF